DAVLTGLIIQLMAPDILLGRIVSVIQTLFYANMDTRTPFISTAIFVVAHTLFATGLVHFIGLAGLPIAVSLASISNTIYMMWKLQNRFGPLGWSELRVFAFRLAATCAVGGIGIGIGTKFTAITSVSYSFARLLDVAMPTAFAICSFTLAAFLF